MLENKNNSPHEITIDLNLYSLKIIDKCNTLHIFEEENSDNICLRLEDEYITLYVETIGEQEDKFDGLIKPIHKILTLRARFKDADFIILKLNSKINEEN